MIDITILHWKISPYFICFLSSFVLAYAYVAWYLKKAGVKGSHIFYSELLNTVLALYFGAFYTFIVQLLGQGKVETFGFSSLGGMAGIMLGVWIFTKISKEHKMEFWTAYVLALGLMYGVSKLGCFFAGCCAGIRYQGLGSIRYLENGVAGESLFPVQLVETILFLLAFFLLHRQAKLGKKEIIAKSLLLYAILKFALDYLRYYESRKIFSANHWVCLLVMVLVLFYKAVQAGKEYKKEK
jgi:prolipoprotein diacylglyceryltransferase